MPELQSRRGTGTESQSGERETRALPKRQREILRIRETSREWVRKAQRWGGVRRGRETPLPQEQKEGLGRERHRQREIRRDKHEQRDRGKTFPKTGTRREGKRPGFRERERRRDIEKERDRQENREREKQREGER